MCRLSGKECIAWGRATKWVSMAPLQASPPVLLPLSQCPLTCSLNPKSLQSTGETYGFIYPRTESSPKASASLLCPQLWASSFPAVSVWPAAYLPAWLPHVIEASIRSPPIPLAPPLGLPLYPSSHCLLTGFALSTAPARHSLTFSAISVGLLPASPLPLPSPNACLA